MIPNGIRQSPEASPDLLQRIRRRVVVDARGCWLWQGARNSRGYAAMARPVPGRPKPVATSVHRIVLELTVGPIPPGMMALHHCDVRHCVNPEHLYIGSAADNMRDLYARGTPNNVLATMNAQKQSCKRGHPFSVSNTLVRRDGSRTCRECRREYDRRRRAA